MTEAGERGGHLFIGCKFSKLGLCHAFEHSRQGGGVDGFRFISGELNDVVGNLALPQRRGVTQGVDGLVNGGWYKLVSFSGEHTRFGHQIATLLGRA